MTGGPGYCVHQYRSDEYCPACKMIEAEAEVERLRAALEKYGRHGETCGAQWLVETGPCTCGLDKALKGAEEGE